MIYGIILVIGLVSIIAYIYLSQKSYDFFYKLKEDLNGETNLLSSLICPNFSAHYEGSLFRCFYYKGESPDRSGTSTLSWFKIEAPISFPGNFIISPKQGSLGMKLLSLPTLGHKIQIGIPEIDEYYTIKSSVPDFAKNYFSKKNQRDILKDLFHQYQINKLEIKSDKIEVSVLGARIHTVVTSNWVREVVKRIKEIASKS